MRFASAGSFGAIVHDVHFSLSTCAAMVVGGAGRTVFGPDRVDGAKGMILGAVGFPFFTGIAVAETAVLIYRGAMRAGKEIS